MPTHHELRSVDTESDDNHHHHHESDDKMSGDAVEVTRVQMRLPVTMRPRLATLTSDTDTEVSSSCEVTQEVGGWEVRPEATLTPGDRVDSGDKSDDVTAVTITKTNTTNTTSDKSSVSTNTVSFMQ